jgi:NADH:ubiquinone oxidoreductase subunit K
MQLILLIVLISFFTAVIRIIYKKKFLLSILISLELMLLNLIILKIILSFKLGKRIKFSFSIFLLTLSAIEARIGISLLALITRKFKTNKINKVNILKK